MSNIYKYQEIIDFWYSDRVRKLWFVSTPEFDEEISQRFEGLWQEASEDGLNQWQETPMGVLALAIVLDQFPLNMFRGTAKSFTTEKLAVTVVKDAIEKGFNKQISKDKLSFLYMPLMHSESVDDQNLSLAMMIEAELELNIRFAEHHRDIIERFGRFPHRNRLLGRVSSIEELLYLDSKEAFLG